MAGRSCRGRDNVAASLIAESRAGSGRDRYPKLPALPGAETFAGKLLHSSQYKGPEAFAGQRVVVVGVGRSGVDLAVELSQAGAKVVLSTTTGAWFMPRTLLGRPWDHYLTRLADCLPYRLRLFFFHQLLAREYRRLGFTEASLRARGVPLPTFDLWRARFTPCQPAFLQRLHDGTIRVKHQLLQMADRQVQFADGSTVYAIMRRGWPPFWDSARDPGATRASFSDGCWTLFSSPLPT